MLLMGLILIGNALAGGPTLESDDAQLERSPISIDRGHLMVIASEELEHQNQSWSFWSDDFDSVTVTNDYDRPIELLVEIEGDGFSLKSGETSTTVELIPNAWTVQSIAYTIPEEGFSDSPMVSITSQEGTMTLTAIDLETGEELYSNEVILEANVMEVPSYEDLQNGGMDAEDELDNLEPGYELGSEENT